MKTIAFIGGGNMGEALIAGLLKSKQWKPNQIRVTDVRPEALTRLKKKYRVQTGSDNRKAVQGASIILLAVKPQQIRQLLSDVGSQLKSNQLILSIAAGISTATIESFLASGVPVVRVMPNTPALVGAGAAGVAAGQFAKLAHLKVAEGILSTVGKVERVPESLMDAVTAVSGSGPAYVFYVAEAMKAVALELGLHAKAADMLVRQTILGAGLLLSQSEDEPEVLRQRVTSPGGTTQAALEVLEQGGLKPLFAKALRRAAQRSQELSQEGTKA